MGTGIDFAKSDVDLNWQDWTAPTFSGYQDIDQSIGSRTYPVADAHGRNLELLADEEGGVYGLGPGFEILIWPSFDAALESLLRGKTVPGQGTIRVDDRRVR